MLKIEKEKGEYKVIDGSNLVRLNYMPCIEKAYEDGTPTGDILGGVTLSGPFKYRAVELDQDLDWELIKHEGKLLLLGTEK